MTRGQSELCLETGTSRADLVADPVSETPPLIWDKGAEQVVANGYRAIPIVPRSKRPACKGWVNTQPSWTKSFPNHGIGIVTGGNERALCAVDIDSTHPQLVADLVMWCHQHLGDAPQRTGAMPKTLLVYRTATEWKKRTSSSFVDANGTVHRLELLGRGQQFVAFGIHPNTNAPYRWGTVIEVLLGQAPSSPYTRPAGDLVCISEDGATALIAEFERLALRHGLAPEGRGASDAPPLTSSSLSDERVMVPAGLGSPPVGTDAETIESLLAKLPPDWRDNYEPWIRVGMALHHETAGAQDGLDLWDAWSQRSPKYRDRAEIEQRWASFGRYSGDPVTLRTLIAATRSATTIDDRRSTERFELVHIAEIARRPPPEWIIRGLLPAQGLGVLYGPSGAGKSFCCLDLIMTVARGIAWRGVDAKQGPVVYICAEGRGGLSKRLQAYAKHHDVDLKDIPIHVIEAAPDFRTPKDPREVTEIIRDTIGQAALVVVDTLAQVAAGANENAAEEMAPILRYCQELGEKVGAMVLLVHHIGKDAARGMRGWSGIRAAIDTALELIPANPNLPDRVAELVVTKQKDGEEGRHYAFKLVTVELAGGETSCVIDHAVMPVKSSEPKGKDRRLLYDLVEELSASGQAPNQAELIEEAVARKRAATDGTKVRADHLKAAVKKLIAEGHLVTSADGRLAQGVPGYNFSAISSEEDDHTQNPK